MNAYSTVFNISVDKTEFSRLEKIKISLELSNAVNISEPDLSTLYDLGFSLIKQHKFMKTTNINGTQEDLVSWNYVLSTKLTGKVIIPSVSINTQQGKLYTKPVSIFIADKVSQNDAIKGTVHIEGNIENITPVLNQNLIYTVKITRYINIHKPQLSSPTSDNAVIQEIFEPQSEEVVLNGRNAIVSEYYYLVTPIKAGKVTLSAPVLSGYIIDNATSKYRDPFDFGSFSSFRNYKDFSVSANVITLKVTKEKNLQYPWLPVTHLKASIKNLNIDKVKVGDAITGNILLTGYNITGDQLPKIIFPEVPNLKIYTETSVKNTNYDNTKKRIIGSKQVKFTMIPAKDGNISFPEIKIAWWDTNKDKLSFAKTKSFNFSVSKAVSDSDDFAVIDYGIKEVDDKLNNSVIFLLFIINALLIILLVVMIFVNYRQRKIIKLYKHNDKCYNQKKLSRSINKYGNAHELHDFCLEYFQMKFNFKTYNLEELFCKIETELLSNPRVDKLLRELKIIFIKIDDALYGKKTLPENVKKELGKILKKLPKKIIKKPSMQNKLNPF